MDGLPCLQRLAPHRDTQLVVGHIPALLAKTLGLEAGESPVVRDGHSLSRHGLIQEKEGGGERERVEGEGGFERLLVGPEETR